MTSSISGNYSNYYNLLDQSNGSSSSNATKTMSASDMFDKLTSELGGDGKTITKSELESYIQKVESDTSGTYDKGELGFLNQLDENWDSISGGSDNITESQIESGMSYLQPPMPPMGSSDSSLFTDLFSALSDATGADSSGISLDDLKSYLTSLTSSSTTSDATENSSSTSSTELNKEISLIKDLIDNFDDFSTDGNTITSSSFYNALHLPQEPSTVTADQLNSPINISV